MVFLDRATTSSYKVSIVTVSACLHVPTLFNARFQPFSRRISETIGYSAFLKIAGLLLFNFQLIKTSTEIIS